MKTSEKSAMQYYRLEPEKILATLDTLARRVGERFPESGLFRVATDLAGLGAKVAQRTRGLSRPFLLLRSGVWLLLIGLVAGQIYLLRFAPFHAEPGAPDLLSAFQGLEAAVNLLLLAGAGVWFLLTLEERMKRRRALDALHELRSIAHIIDMHQLTKDPTIILGNYHRRTSHSPARVMSEFELTRYLEYCAEMLALVGKLAALYAENMRDPVVIEAVNDIENLCGNLGRKIWQKITIIKQLDEHPPASPS